MSFFSNFQLGFGSYSDAFSFMRKHRLLYYFLVPLVLNVLLFLFTASYVGMLTECTIEQITSWWMQDAWNFWGSEWIKWSINLVLEIVLYAFFFLVFAFLGGYMILIVMSPILSLLSEKIDEILRGEKYKFRWGQFIKEVFRGIAIAVRNFTLETLFAILLFFLSFIPVVGFLSSPLLFFISSYYYGASFLDYSFERKGMSVGQTMRYMRKNKGLAIGNGMPFALTMMIPYFGVKISTFTAVLSTAAGTIAVYEKDCKEGTTTGW